MAMAAATPAKIAPQDTGRRKAGALAADACFQIHLSQPLSLSLPDCPWDGLVLGKRSCQKCQLTEQLKDDMPSFSGFYRAQACQTIKPDTARWRNARTAGSDSQEGAQPDGSSPI